MPITIVVGGQFGSEGKGKVCAYLAEKEGADIMVRCGGSNSGHTVIYNDKPVIFRHLAAGALHTNCRLLIPAGAYIDVNVLLKEIEEHDIDLARVGIDANAVIITNQLIKEETDSDLKERIGSTQSGTGAAVSARINRKKSVLLAKDCKDLKKFITNVSEEVIKANQVEKKVIIEGTQGFGLSVFHSPHYPYTTSRDTTASGFASEVGISPLDVDEVIMVIRAFPIRVPGSSGPLKNEINWGQITQESNSPIDLEEKTSVTQKVRRVGLFDNEIVEKAILLNKPTRIFLNHLDYVDASVLSDKEKLLESQEIRNFLNKISFTIAIGVIGFGPKNQDLIEGEEYCKSLLSEVHNG